MDKDQVHDVVKSGYAEVARQKGGCCGNPTASAHAETAALIGYAERDITGDAAEANLGLGCGNPTALASLKAGETVIDLGSGAGFDALLAAEKLGPEGRFIGVDMTPEMLERARTNAVNAGHARTVEFREGLIENLPVASESADAVISNCVINLSPDKAQVFREAYRVLKPGGRIAVSDILLSEPLPSAVAKLAATWIACVGGASTERPVLVIGGGRVGQAVASALAPRGAPVHVIDKKDVRRGVFGKEVRFIRGDAADRDVLRQAGLEEASAVVLTTNADAVNIYLELVPLPPFWAEKRMPQARS